MKLSISIVDIAPEKAPFVLRGDYFENVLVAKEIGYDAVEIHVRNPECIDAAALNDLCRKRGIAVSSIGTGLSYAVDGLSFMSRDEDIRVKAVYRVRDYIKLAQTLDSIVIIGLIKGIIPSGESHDVCEARVVDCINGCIEEAEKRNVILVLEAINRYESNFLVNITETIAFIKKFKTNKLKIHIDSFHMNIEEAKIEESIYMCKGILGHVHFADNDRMYPGHGHIQFEKIIDGLNAINYEGYIAIECLSLPEPVEAAKKTLEYMRLF